MESSRWNIHEVESEGVPQRTLPRLAPQQLVVPEEPENEQRIEEIIQVCTAINNLLQVSLHKLFSSSIIKY